jgi:hypothetical protein
LLPFFLVRHFFSSIRMWIRGKGEKSTGKSACATRLIPQAAKTISERLRPAGIGLS